MYRFKDWLLQSETWTKFLVVLGPAECNVFMREVDFDQLGMGAPGMYNCTYGFVAQVFIFKIRQR